MTPNEFRAWFDGFVEGIEGPPTVKQWARIVERVAEIDGKPVTQTVFVGRYWPSYPRWGYWPGHQGGYYAAQGGNFQNQCNNGLQAVAAAGQNMMGPLVGSGQSLSAIMNAQSSKAAYRAAAYAAQTGREPNDFDSQAAMHALGRKERNEIN